MTVNPGAWAEKMYRPDVADNWDNLYKKPGDDPFEWRRSMRT